MPLLELTHQFSVLVSQSDKLHWHQRLIKGRFREGRKKKTCCPQGQGTGAHTFAHAASSADQASSMASIFVLLNVSIHRYSHKATATIGMGEWKKCTQRSFMPDFAHIFKWRKTFVDSMHIIIMIKISWLVFKVAGLYSSSLIPLHC